MSIRARLAVLRAKHAILKEKTQNAFTHHSPDAELIQMKKEKLHLKEEIAELEKRMDDSTFSSNKIAA